jgi:uncharacterized protein YneF (UPF0154 family)
MIWAMIVTAIVALIFLFIGFAIGTYVSQTQRPE